MAALKIDGLAGGRGPLPDLDDPTAFSDEIAGEGVAGGVVGRPNWAPRRD